MALALRAVGAKAVIGSSGEAIVGTAREVENEPAVAVWLACLPGAVVTPFRLQFERTSEGGTFLGWPDELMGAWPERSTLFLLADPFTFPADALLERMNEDRAGVPVFGGMASGAHEPRGNRLIVGEETHAEGAVAALVSGANIRAAVSQGCRPIGRPMVITKAERNVIFELGGVPAMNKLREVFATLDGADRQRMQRGLHIGRVINEYQERFGRGDFLIRNCLGADPEKGAIAVGDYVRAGQTVQFHVRDAESADDDLRDVLSTTAAEGPALAALVFTCNGRGVRLFESPHHDAMAIAKQVGEVPTAGFFAQGEIGPIGGRNFLHGFTASMAIFGE